MSGGPVDTRQRDVIAVGETMVYFLAESYGSLRYSERFQRYVGGTESNTLVSLAKFGFSTGWISRLGSDEFGYTIRDFVRGHGVDVSQVVFDEEAPTGVFFVEKNANDETKSFYYRSGSAACRMNLRQIDMDYFTSYRVLHTTGITPILSPACREMTETLFQTARDRGMKVSFDPNLRLRMASIEQFRSVVLPLLPLTDVFLPNDKELCLLMDTDVLEEAVDRALEMGVGTLVLKLGDRGCMLMRGSVKIEEPVFPVKQTVSSMAAGDAFNAGYLAGMLKGFTDVDCLKLANCVGGLATLGWGPYESIPSWDDVMTYLAGRGVLER